MKNRSQNGLRESNPEILRFLMVHCITVLLDDLMHKNDVYKNGSEHFDRSVPVPVK